MQPIKIIWLYAGRLLIEMNFHQIFRFFRNSIALKFTAGNVLTALKFISFLIYLKSILENSMIC